MENKNRQSGRSVLGRGLSALISTPPVALAALKQAAPLNTPAVNGSTALKPEISLVEITPESSPAPAVYSDTTASAGKNLYFLPISKIKPNTIQPRQIFKESEIKELGESIRAMGVLQPLLVRKAAAFEQNGEYELIAGERRWRASKLIGLEQVPVIIKDFTDQESLEVALVENVQREDLNPVEQAIAYQKLIDTFALSQQEVADRLGKDRATVANIVRLLKLPKEVLDLLQNGEISMGHAKVILSIKEPTAQSSIARKVVKEGLSVRALEALVSQVVVLDSGRRPSAQQKRQSEEQNLDASFNPFPQVVDRMRNSLATKVTIKHHKSGRGKIEIEYFSEQELDRLVEQICRS